MKVKNKSSVGKKILKVVLIILAVIGLFLGGTFIAHRLSLRSEASQIKPYGELHDVFDGQMNVLIEGTGPETIVLLPGYGTAAPALDFNPLITELKTKYRVVTIEPFGYGLSSQTKRERSVENMLAEIHEVTTQLKLKSYILMGHSIAGIYGINYVAAYPEEVKGFVGVDTSVPNQPWPGFDDRLLTFAQKSGLVRLLTKFDSSRKDNDERAEQTRMITMRNSSNDTIRRELASLSESFAQTKGKTFPMDLPVLLFVAKHDDTMDNWLGMHEEQVAGLNKGKVIELPGSHYLHHTQSATIATEVEAFFN